MRSSILLLLSVTVVLALSEAVPARAQGTPVLSRTQVDQARTLERIASIRVEPRRTDLSRTIAGRVEDDLFAAYDTYFVDFPKGPPRPEDAADRTALGRLVCRLIAREHEGVVAIYSRCNLGNMQATIMFRDDLAVVPRAQTIETARRLIVDAVRRIAFSFLKTRGMTPVWRPD